VSFNGSKNDHKCVNKKINLAPLQNFLAYVVHQQQCCLKWCVRRIGPQEIIVPVSVVSGYRFLYFNSASVIYAMNSVHGSPISQR
jgi:hypothetical protein